MLSIDEVNNLEKTNTILKDKLNKSEQKLLKLKLKNKKLKQEITHWKNIANEYEQEFLSLCVI